MTKTRQLLPMYDCIEAKMVGGNIPEFTMKVTCYNRTACGSGSTKKVAKENAAKEMLAIIRMDPSFKEIEAVANQNNVCMMIIHL